MGDLVSSCLKTVGLQSVEDKPVQYNRKRKQSVQVTEYMKTKRHNELEKYYRDKYSPRRQSSPCIDQLGITGGGLEVPTEQVRRSSMNI